MTRWVTLPLAFCLLAEAAFAAPKHSEFQLPPYAGAYEPQGVDERGLWMQVDDFERTLQSAPDVIRDEALNRFVRGVLCRTVGEDRCATARIYIVRESSFNATMSANGLMFVHSGLLFRLRSEAELAAILAHEFGHFEKRHSLNGFRQRRRATDIAAWASFFRNGRDIIDNVQIAYWSYKRSQEVEADVISAQYLTASPYPNRAAADIWLRLMDESDATAAERHQPSHRYDKGSYFDSHPPENVRAAYLSQIAKANPDDGDPGAESYAAAVAPWMPDFFDEQLKRNDFAGTDFILGQLAIGGWTPDLLMFRGHLYRQRGNPRDLVSAVNFYQQAIASGVQRAECWRGLGLAQMRLGAVLSGKAALSEYLRRAPEAKDRATILSLVEG